MKNQIYLVLDAEQALTTLKALRFTRKQYEKLAEAKNAPQNWRIIETLTNLIIYLEIASSVSKLNNK